LASRIWSGVLKDLADLEIEFRMAVVAEGAPNFHGSEDGVDDKSPNDVSREVRRLRSIRKPIGLADLERTEKIDGAA
jgi:hypothetical protein